MCEGQDEDEGHGAEVAFVDAVDIGREKEEHRRRGAPDDAGGIESEDDYISASDHVRFEKLSRTVGMLLRNKDYYFAAKRILSVWEQDCLETTYINYLILRSERVTSLR